MLSPNKTDLTLPYLHFTFPDFAGISFGSQSEMMMLYANLMKAACGGATVQRERERQTEGEMTNQHTSPISAQPIQSLK